jgi:hypothetical protein
MAGHAGFIADVIRWAALSLLARLVRRLLLVAGGLYCGNLPAAHQKQNCRDHSN